MGDKIIDFGSLKNELLDRFEKNIQAHWNKDAEFIIDDITEPKGDWLEREYDLALLLNVVPIIERIKRGSTLELLNKLKAKSILLSLPLYSIGGRKYIGHYWKRWAYDNLRDIIASKDNKEMLILLKSQNI